jgi:hypothetical protein
VIENIVNQKLPTFSITHRHHERKIAGWPANTGCERTKTLKGNQREACKIY